VTFGAVKLLAAGYQQADEKAATDRIFSIDDLDVSSLGIFYFTTLKDPERLLR